jgi:hypothetical protein
VRVRDRRTAKRELESKGAPVAGADGSARRAFGNALLANAQGESKRRIGSEEMVLAVRA